MVLTPLYNFPPPQRVRLSLNLRWLFFHSLPEYRQCLPMTTLILFQLVSLFLSLVVEYS